MKLNHHKKESVITINKQHTNTIRNTKIYTMAVTALMTAVTCSTFSSDFPYFPDLAEDFGNLQDRLAVISSDLFQWPS